MRCQRISNYSKQKCNGLMRLDVEDLPKKTYVCFMCHNVVYVWRNKDIKKRRRQWLSVRYAGKTSDLKKRILYVKLTRGESGRSTTRPSITAKCPHCRWPQPMKEVKFHEQNDYRLKCRFNHKITLRIDKNPATWV